MSYLTSSTQTLRIEKTHYCDLSRFAEIIFQIQVDSPITFSGQTSSKDMFVIPSLLELDNQPELKNYLIACMKLIEQGDVYLINDIYQAP